VENGEFKKDVPLHDDMDTVQMFLDYSTIDEVYATIEDAFLEYHDTRQSKRDFYYTEIVVEYDRTNHIPTRIVYKYYCPPNLAVDGTFHYGIENFMPTKQADN